MDSQGLIPLTMRRQNTRSCRQSIRSTNGRPSPATPAPPAPSSRCRPHMGPLTPAGGGSPKPARASYLESQEAKCLGMQASSILGAARVQSSSATGSCTTAHQPTSPQISRVPSAGGVARGRLTQPRIRPTRRFSARPRDACVRLFALLDACVLITYC